MYEELPFKSAGYLKYEIEKAVNREGTVTMPNIKKDNDKNKIYNTYSRDFNVEKEGIGIWKLKINPLFNNNLFEDSIRYGWVIVVESSQERRIYSNIPLDKSGQIEKNTVKLKTDEGNTSLVKYFQSAA